MIQIILNVIFLVGLTLWFIIDRHFYIKKNSKIIDEIEAKFKTLNTMRNEYVDDNKWSQTLLVACNEEHEWLARNFRPGWTMDKLSIELDKAAKEYVNTFNNQENLKPKVARIINLLYIYTISKNEEELSKADQLQKLRLKNLN
jgi:hypothetical protein